jgi:phosphomannomutase
MTLSCFKAYDIRGRVPEQLNEHLAEDIGRAYAAFLKPQRVIVGHDIRLTSPALTDAVARGLNACGVDVFHIGECGTEEVYFAASQPDMDGGIMVTASHNPMDYNGMKLVREGARPISGDTGLFDIRDRAAARAWEDAAVPGLTQPLHSRPNYLEHLLTYVNPEKLTPLRIVVNPGNGGAGSVIDALAPRLPFQFERVHFEPDGRFPNGVPNPLLEENRAVTANAVRRSGADLGIAWDGDFDRCFFFDENGDFVEGYYLVGLLAEYFLTREPGSAIVHDPRLVWNTLDVAQQHHGRAVQSKTGHAFIKERMRLEDAIYGGEMSAHHYFRDFAYCDSGMIPWLLIAQLIAERGQPLSKLMAARQARFPCSGEINRALADPPAALAAIEAEFAGEALLVEHVDGLSMAFANWRFNLRASNTEPVVRLNVETRADPELLSQRTQLLLERLAAFA